MNRKTALLLMLLVLIPLCLADDNLYAYGSLSLKTNLNSKIELKNTAPDYVIDFVAANITWIPSDDYRQSITRIETDPEARLNKTLEFRWSSPSSRILPFQAAYYVTTYNRIKEVSRKEDFPIRHLPREYQEYLKEQEIIDITPEIAALAARLTEDEDDLFRAVFRLATWVKSNIAYDLNTLALSANQKSSWVLEHRQGVCGELSALFISMCRSLGIPAKFVSGIAFTNLEQFENPWGPHGWAEVYFPEAGWVPVDVTYGQIGFLDATHIKMQESLDAKQSSAHYISRGRNIEIQTERLDTSTTLINKGGLAEQLVDLDLEIIYGKTGFGSYNLIELKVKNKKPHYVAETFILSRTAELEVQDEHVRAILLAPYEEKTIQWPVVVSNQLKKGYTYTFTAMVETSRGHRAKSQFQAASNGRVYSYNDIKGRLIKEIESEKKTGLSINCEGERKKAYLGETLIINCRVENNGVNTEHTEACFEGECRKESLQGISGFDASFEKMLDKTGVQNFLIELRAADTVKKAYVLIDVLDDAVIYIESLKFPEKILYSETASITFTLESDSESVPENIKLKLKHKYFRQDWDIMDLRRPVDAKFEVGGSNLDFKNEFVIIADYEDELGKKFTTSKQFRIELTEVNFLERIMVYSNRIENWIEGLF